MIVLSPALIEARHRLYAVLLAIQPLLILHGVANETTAPLWISLASAVLGNGVAVLTTENARRWIYGVALAASALAVVYNLTTEVEATLWVAVIAALIGNGTATVASGQTIEANGRVA